jgi:hypothetical protein
MFVIRTLKVRLINMQFKFDLENRNKYTYTTYRALVDECMGNGETTDKDESDEMLDYTKVNVARMTRLDKTVKINDRLKGALVKTVRQRWVVLTEGWCGDAAQNLPIISKMVDFSFNVEMDILLREENLDIMDKFLTKKGRAIPKLIAYDEDNKVLFTWGPRPEKMQERAMEMKKAKEEYGQEIHKLYAKDRAVSIQAEFTALLSQHK